MYTENDALKRKICPPSCFDGLLNVDVKDIWKNEDVDEPTEWGPTSPFVVDEANMGLIVG